MSVDPFWEIKQYCQNKKDTYEISKGRSLVYGSIWILENEITNDNINDMDSSGNNILMFLVKYNCKILAEMLLKNKDINLDLNIQNTSGRTVLHLLILNYYAGPNIKLLKLLLNYRN